MRVWREIRSEHSAVIWYGRPGDRAAPAVSLSAPARKAARAVGMVVPSWGRRCGVAEYARNLAGALRAAGTRVEVAGGPCRHLDDWAAWQGVDVVHLQCEYGLWEAPVLREETAALLRKGRRVIVTLHSAGPHPHNAILAASCQKIIVLSEPMRGAALELGYPPERLTVVPMGVSTTASDGRPRNRDRLLLPDDSFTVASCGFFYPQKEYLDLVRAVRLVGQARPARAVLYAPVADNPLSREVHDLFCAAVAAEGLGPWVSVVTDYLAEGELIRRLAATDVIVFPYSEIPARQTSAAVRLGLAAGRPVVVSDVFAFADLGEEVLKVPGTDGETLAGALLSLAANPRLRAGLSDAARAYARRHTWTMVATRHAEIYESL